MLNTLTSIPSQAKPTEVDRPAWIPPEITHDWDTNPYAYQNEEDLMAAGGPHNQLLAYIMELLRHFLAGKDLMFLMDSFMLYRDAQGIKQRIAPDLLLMPYRDRAPTAYDLDVEPPPRFVVEVTSKESHLKDLHDNVSLYLGLGIQEYLVIDAITPQGELLPQIQFYLWRSIGGQVQQVATGTTGPITLNEAGLQLEAIGRQLIFTDPLTAKVLFDVSDFSAALTAKEEALELEQEARQEAEAKLATVRQDHVRETVLIMWRKGLEPSLITEVTGLSEAELQALIDAQ